MPGKTSILGSSATLPSMNQRDAGTDLTRRKENSTPNGPFPKTQYLLAGKVFQFAPEPPNSDFGRFGSEFRLYLIPCHRIFDAEYHLKLGENVNLRDGSGFPV